MVSEVPDGGWRLLLHLGGAVDGGGVVAASVDWAQRGFRRKGPRVSAAHPGILQSWVPRPLSFVPIDFRAAAMETEVSSCGLLHTFTRKTSFGLVI